MESTAVVCRPRDETWGGEASLLTRLSAAAQAGRPPLFEKNRGEKAAQGLRQPWTDYWPPRHGDHLYQELASKYPAVLQSRKFEAGRLFEQPWREWTTPYAEPPASPGAEAVRPVRMENYGWWHPGVPLSSKPYLMADFCSSAERHVYGSTSWPTKSHGVDRLIQGLNLDSVCPPDFFYLANLELYRREKPFRCQLPRVPGYRMSNIEASRHHVRIHNIAGHENLFTLDEAGFEFTKCPVQLPRLRDEDVIKDYLPWLQTWLKELLGCQLVFFYAYNVSYPPISSMPATFLTTCV
jgi:hypothetical protein